MKEVFNSDRLVPPALLHRRMSDSSTILDLRLVIPQIFNRWFRFLIEDIFSELQLILAIVSLGNWQSGSILHIKQGSKVTRYSSTVVNKTGGSFPP